MRPSLVWVSLKVPGCFLKKVCISHDFVPADAVTLPHIGNRIFQAERGKVLLYVGQIHAYKFWKL